jgi:radical SAM-linked protein
LITVRVFFRKEGRAKYISHLDLNRCIQRALNRSGLPVWYTEGFHPHLYLTFALPLSLGFESICESFECKVEELNSDSAFLERLNSVLPEGIKAFRVAQPVHPASEISFADYSVLMKSDDSDSLADDWDRFWQMEQIIVEKKTKKGSREMDIKPFLSILSSEHDSSSLCLRIRCPAGNELNLNPMLLIDSFQNFRQNPLNGCHVCRTAIYVGDLKVFE